MTTVYPINELTEKQLTTLARQLEQGAVMAFATDTVYGIGTNAFNEQAISRIYQMKRRPAGVALQILVGTVEQTQQWVQWNKYAQRLAQAYWPGGLTLILPPNEKGRPLSRGFAGLGLRVPAQPGLVRLLSVLTVPIASTSANLHGQSVITREEELIDFAENQADIILVGGTLSAQASSVVDLTQNTPYLIREGCISRRALEETAQTVIK